MAYKHLIIIVLEAGKSKIKAPADAVSDEGLLPGSYIKGHCLLIMSSDGKRSKEALEASFIWALILISYPFPSLFLLQSCWPLALGHARHVPTAGALHFLFPCLWTMYIAGFCIPFNSLLKCCLVRENFPDPFTRKIKLLPTQMLSVFVLLYFSP